MKKKCVTFYISIMLILVLFFGVREIFFDVNAMFCRRYVGVIMILLIGVIVMTAVVFFFKNIKVHSLALIFIILWGVVIGMLMPPGIAPDEPRHFLAAYEVSNRILGTSAFDEVNEETGLHTIMMRKCDVLSEEELIEWQTSVSVKEYSTISNGTILERNVADRELIKENRYTVATTDFFKYIPSALGICLARLLHLGKYPLMYLGRFFNLLFFAGCVCWGVKQLDKGKYALLSVGSMPMVLCLASSFSYDAISNGLSVLFLASFFSNCADDDRISVKNIVIMLVSYVLLMPYKKIYVVFILLIITLIYTKRKRIKKEIMGIFAHLDKRIQGLFLIILGVLLGVVIYKLFSMLLLYGRAFFDERIVVSADTEEVYFGIVDFIETPRRMFYYLFDSIQSYFPSIVQGAFTFPWVGLSTIAMWGLFFCCILVLFSSRAEGYGKSIKRVCCVVFVLMTLCALLGCMVSMTTKEHQFIYGFQARYVLPGITMLMIAWGTNELFEDRLKKIFYAQNLFLVIAVLNMLRKVIVVL